MLGPFLCSVQRAVHCTLQHVDRIRIRSPRILTRKFYKDFSFGLRVEVSSRDVCYVKSQWISRRPGSSDASTESKSLSDSRGGVALNIASHPLRRISWQTSRAR